VWSNGAALTQTAPEMRLWIHTHVREDEITLYGFLTLDELKLFELLLSVNGVGPKAAISLLNQPVNELQNAIQSADPTWLSKTPGIGKKTAERIVLELSGKLSLIESTKLTTLNNEVVETLESLGYKRSHIENLFKDLPEEVQSTEEKVRWFLARN
jgi:Holliday junction DNA helicase RuvA